MALLLIAALTRFLMFFMAISGSGFVRQILSADPSRHSVLHVILLPGCDDIGDMVDLVVEFFQRGAKLIQPAVEDLIMSHTIQSPAHAVSSQIRHTSCAKDGPQPGEGKKLFFGKADTQDSRTRLQNRHINPRCGMSSLLSRGPRNVCKQSAKRS